jgi:hypothetical protein
MQENKLYYCSRLYHTPSFNRVPIEQPIVNLFFEKFLHVVAPEGLLPS